MLRSAGAILISDGSWTAGKNDTFRFHPFKSLGRHAERSDFAIDARFSYAPGDELCHLTAKIDDQDGFFGRNSHKSLFTSTEGFTVAVSACSSPLELAFATSSRLVDRAEIDCSLSGATAKQTGNRPC